ncbi:CBS domain-containing protein [Halorubrum aethiopicum]|uniref:CBS domain-containing protein n=1 Tax=Halorubrum aethiopicum TaxID=1758255 RepID=UPI0008364299|nr:CBS domain-containing protein [Halorubrum aethiopicum]
MELPTPQDLRERRTSLELTQSALADAAGVSQPLIARIEGGDVDPRLSTLRRIVNALQEAEGEVVRATDLMNETVISVAPDDAVSDAVDLMEREAYSQLPVLQNGVPVGSISQGDVVHAGENVGDHPVSEVMSESFPTVAPGATVDEVRNLLDHYKAVMVTDGGETVGIITEADIAAHLS